MNDQIVIQVGTVEFYLGVAGLSFLLALFISVFLPIGRRIVDAVWFQASLRTREIEIELRAHPDVPDEIMGLKMLFVRYGNDQYLRDLASDQERFHGRLRNAVRAIAVEPPEGTDRMIKVRLRIHKRLGTQFKFFVEVEGNPERVVAYLKGHPTIENVDVTNRPFRTHNDEGRYRVFFIVNRFPTVTTVDGHINNFIYPV